MTNTINEIYEAINPIPAMLSAKGKVQPGSDLQINANSNVCVSLTWQTPGSSKSWDKEYKCFNGDTADEALAGALAFIRAMPDAKTARIHDFMGQLGKVIDSGRELGIDVGYLNPLTDTMKRLSENIITHQPAGVSA